jgi:hypothetical protein
VSDLGLIGRTLMAVGGVILVLGLAILLASKVPYIGRLPGDFVWKRGHFSFYFPLATCLVASLLVSLILYLFRK